MIEKIKKFINVVQSIIRQLFKQIFSPYIFTFIVIIIWSIQFVYANNWLNQKIGNFSNFGYFTWILFVILVGDYLYKSHVISFIKIPEINPLDVVFISLTIIVLGTVSVFQLTKTPVSTFIKNKWRVGLIICFILMGFRVCQLTRAKLTSTNEEVNNKLHELKELENIIPWKKEDGPILVNEKDATYDLLNRGNVKKLLESAIKKYSLHNSVVIGLVGEWGSGKTTLLNLVKREIEEEEDIVFIHSPTPTEKTQDFDIWLFGSQESLIKGMYDFILNGLGIQFSSIVNDKFLDSIAHVVAGLPKAGSILSSLLTDRSYKNILNLKEKLSKYLLSTNKHYVFCIENLDRATNTQVILLLKLINTVFNLPNVTYVLLYSESRMNKILEGINDINHSYLEKVVNLEIKMPIDFDRTRPIPWLQNLICSYGVSKKHLGQYNFVLNFIATNLKDVRDLKRIINSTFSIMTISDTLRLNLPQVLAIQYIYFSNNELYNEIKSHKEMFTFEDNYNFEIDKTKELSDKEISYFDSLLSKYNKYEKLLIYLFPKFRRFMVKNNMFISFYGDTKNNLKAVAINTRRYFDNYFYLAENNHVYINNYIREFINNVNFAKGNIESTWKNFLSENELSNLEELFSELNLFLEVNDIPNSQIREELAEVVFKSASDKDHLLNRYELQLTYIISKLIGEVDKKDFIKFENKIFDDYASLKIIGQIFDFLKETIGGRSTNLIRNTEEMSKTYDNMRKDIFYKKVDLFQDEYYSWRNATEMYKYFKEKNIPVSEYLNKVISKNNVYRIIFDFVIITESGNGYKFDMKTLIDCVDFEKFPQFKRILKDNSEKNKDRQKVQKILLAAKKDSEDFIYFDKSINPDKL